MSIESDLRAAVLANANVSSLIDTRVYPGEIPANATLPAIAYQHIASNGERSLGGMYVEHSGRYQMRLVADTYDEIIQLKSAVLEVAGTSYGTLTRIEIDEGPDGYDFETRRYVRVLEILCIT